MFKLVSLRASGFKRLDIEEKLEFPDGRLLVHGRNESGKSTLMEAIHYALYGMPLRPSKNAGNDDIICYGRDKAIVELEFSIDDEEYQVRRELNRKKTNIHLLNKRSQKENLSRVTTGARNVNRQLEEILHGIDSEALLNSCLVEQKELGKLEDANKQERIKAMSSLLNLEAFIDARDGLKKECRDLDKIHSNTLLELQKAEQAKQEYEAAETRKETAEKRLAEITLEKKDVEEKLGKLREQLKVIQQLKDHQTKINEQQTELKGKQESLKLQKETLAEIDRAEQELQSIEEKLLEAEKALTEHEKQIETLQNLNQHYENLRGIESGLDTIEVRISNTLQEYNEVAEAKERTQELDSQIKQYSPVKAASKKLDEITELFNKLNTSNNDATRLEKELEAIQERLGESTESEELIQSLEEQETIAKKKQKKAQNMRILGTAGIFSGLVVAALMIVYTNYTVAALGVAILVAGGYLFATNNPGSLDEELGNIRAQKEDVLGDRARIKEHHENRDRLVTEIEENKEAYSRLQEQIVQELNQLPDEPREYKTVVNLTEPETLSTLREQIQEDTESLTRLTTEKENIQQKAESLESVRESLKSTQKEKETQSKEAKTLRERIDKLEQETGITRENEEEIRNQHTEANKTHAQLITKKNEYEQDLERRPQVQENINETSNEINLITATIQQEEKKIKELEKHGIDLGDEPTLNEERDTNLRKSASLENEEKERNHDITESNTIIEKTEPLKEQYPTLVEDSEREEFRLEAMRRATILLDTTRESIMGGVKQNVEKNMMQFLPTLTDNRYNMARIDETNYRIEVYDREAKTWRGKGVFSGATQDQFSLALRLAFAISTIPSSKGARPGFIFLDEPLSGFDVQRRNGFMQLLREDLSRHFDQIIVISHLEALAMEFQNTLTLEAGRIIEVQR